MFESNLESKIRKVRSSIVAIGFNPSPNQITIVGSGFCTSDDGKLMTAAQMKGEDMLAHDYFAHISPSGVTPWFWMAKTGYTYQVAGENLAFAPTVDIAMSGLMNSPGHKANILKTDFTKLGIGCMDAGPRGKMFSQEFKGD